MELTTMLTAIFVILLTTIWLRYYFKTLRKFAKFPQIKGHILWGNLELFTGKLFEQQTKPLHQRVFEGVITLNNSEYDSDVLLIWLTYFPCVALMTTKSIEVLLTSSKIIDKSRDYNFLKSWLKTGLLTSGSEKWRSRRKFLTPSFHFRILNDFIPIMNKHSRIFVEKLKLKADTDVDIVNYIELETLDVICETAMGVSLGAQMNPESEYVTCMNYVKDALTNRYFNPINWVDFIYYRRKEGKDFKKSLELMHGFTSKVIEKRKKLMIEGKINIDLENADDETMFFGSKRQRIAFMDLLIRRHLDGMKSDGTSDFTLEDIQEEVDTFMFEGSDTSAAALTLILHLLGNNPDVQEKLYEELYSIFAGDKEREITEEDLRNMKYTELCIKETLRLYPSVPIIARIATDELDVCGYKIPKNSTIAIFIYNLHREANNFPDPEKFMPERFLPENCVGRQPFAYIPFSAGPHNCIGQKFAMNEIKIIVADILRNFKIESLKEEIAISIDIITKARKAVVVKFTKRQ